MRKNLPFATLLGKIGMLTKKKQTIMIRWRLRVLMAEKKLNNKTLAEMTGIHRTTISRLKNLDEVKQISSDILNALCIALNCTPNDLLEFTPDPPQNSDELPEREKTKSVVELKHPHLGKPYKSFKNRENKRRKFIA